jgi:hypothetical protein
MKPRTILCCFILVFSIKQTNCQITETRDRASGFDYIESLKDTLESLAERSDNEFFNMHCHSILAVINSKLYFNKADSAILAYLYRAFSDQMNPPNPRDMKTYLERKRPLILAWVSPTDGSVSFSWLTLPKNWDPGASYPLYIQLHGLWSVASNKIEYLVYPYAREASNSTSFEDGYLLSPWGRGNYWYLGISETDIWEGMAALEKIVQVDPRRKYLSGHSMGGYGACSIASKSVDTWAALGIYAGALWYSPDLVTNEVAQALKDVPTYFVCGTEDDLFEVNQYTYRLFGQAGNKNLWFATFTGGHEYVETQVNFMYLWMRQFIKGPPTGTETPVESATAEFHVRCDPNPCTSYSNIVYSGSENSVVNISIYDMYGRLMDEVAKQVRITGENNITYDVTQLNSGIYIIRLKSGDAVAESKMVVTR